MRYNFELLKVMDKIKSMI